MVTYFTVHEVEICMGNLLANGIVRALSVVVAVTQLMSSIW